MVVSHCHQTMATNSRQPAGGKVTLPADPALQFPWKQQSSLHTYLKCLVFVKGLFHLSSKENRELSGQKRSLNHLV